MTPVFDEDFPVFIVDKEQSQSILGLIPKEIIKYNTAIDAISIFEVNTSQDPFSLLEPITGSNEVIKILDKFYLILSTADDANNNTIVSSFFDYISQHYSELIDVEKNLSNIKFLIGQLIHSQLVEKPLIIDFGCGIGLSAKVQRDLILSENIKIDLLGYDISKQMLVMSAQAGIKTINRYRLDKLRDNSVDGIFASYTFHFVKEMDIIELLWSKLKPGGGMVGNFHKNIGLEKFIDFINKLGGEPRLVEYSPSGSVYHFTKRYSGFVQRADISEYMLVRFDISVDPELLSALLLHHIIPVFTLHGEALVLHGDLESIIGFLTDIIRTGWAATGSELYQTHFTVSTPTLHLEFKKSVGSNLEPATIALLRNMLVNYTVGQAKTETTLFSLDGIINVRSNNALVTTYIDDHKNIISKINSSRASVFANSASYMGSKRFLRSFIVESIFSHSKNKIFDLMCGSGAVAGSTALLWDTTVSDAMKFCRILAHVQGGGFSIGRAKEILEFVQTHAITNANKLKQIFAVEIEKEDKIFHSEMTPELQKEYDIFCKSFPGHGANSDTQILYTSSQNNILTSIYCLFTCAYSNLYIGVRQAIEIDSLRFAIEQLHSTIDKTWAMGALVTTLSAVGNTYGGHFAQPKYKDITKLSVGELYKLIEQRSTSVYSEFSVRLREFAMESQSNNPRVIEEMEGPWENALNSYKDKYNSQSTLVYIDAPYTRDEYSRYYHLLETLVKYDYPFIRGVGKVPDKKAGNRFSSDFFTRSHNKLKHVYADLLSSVLDKGYSCAWSYSSNAAVPCAEILDDVIVRTKCQIVSYSTPYTHQGQGGMMAKKIVEYVIILSPRA